MAQEAKPYHVAIRVEANDNTEEREDDIIFTASQEDAIARYKGAVKAFREHGDSGVVSFYAFGEGLETFQGDRAEQNGKVEYFRFVRCTGTGQFQQAEGPNALEPFHDVKIEVPPERPPIKAVVKVIAPPKLRGRRGKASKTEVERKEERPTTSYPTKGKIPTLRTRFHGHESATIDVPGAERRDGNKASKKSNGGQLVRS